MVAQREDPAVVSQQSLLIGRMREQKGGTGRTAEWCQNGGGHLFAGDTCKETVRDQRKEPLVKPGLPLSAETAVAPEPPWRCQAGITESGARRGESRSWTLRAQRSSGTDEETGNLSKRKW